MLHAILELDRSLVYIYFPPSLLPIPIHPRPSFPTPAISLHLLFPSFSHFVNQLSRSSAEGTTRREEKQDVDSLVGAAFTVSFLSTLFSLSSLTFFFSSLFFFSFLSSFLSFFVPLARSRCASPSRYSTHHFYCHLELPTYFSGCCFNLLGSLNSLPPSENSIVSVGLIHRSSLFDPVPLPPSPEFDRFPIRVGGNPVSGQPVPFEESSNPSVRLYRSIGGRSRVSLYLGFRRSRKKKEERDK